MSERNLPVSIHEWSGEWPEKLYGYPKRLSLLAPKKAKEFGFVEAPIFMSPDTRNLETCPKCSAEYTPLVYQAHYITIAQHFHDDRFQESGGIYYHPDRHYSHFNEPFINEEFYGWVANVGPLGRKWYAHKLAAAEQVYVSDIIAFCMRHSPREQLREGYVVASGEFLVPVCQIRKDEGYKPEFSFQIDDTGAVLFSKALF